MSIQEIAQKRGMTKGTILSHIIRIAETDKEIDLEIYRPSEDVFKRVSEAASRQSKEEKISLGKIYSELNKEVSYDEIKQVLIFFNRS